MLADALQGIRVLDLTQIAAGPLATMLLGDLGADIVKLEPPGGDLSRALFPSVEEQSVNYMALNRNKRSIVLDLHDAGSRAQARALALGCDIVVESFRPGVADRLGLGYASLRADHPALVYCSISAYGQEGPQRDHPGVDGVLQAVTGLMSVTGHAGGAPCKVQVPVVDVATGQLAAVAILAALWRSRRDGQGQHLDLSLYNGAMSMQQMSYATLFATGQAAEPTGSAAPYSAPNEALRCADGWLMVAAYHPNRWRALCTVIDAPELADDPRFAANHDRVHHRAALIGELEARMTRRCRAEWMTLLQAADVICGPILDHREASESEQFAHADLRETIPHPVLGSVNLSRSVLKAVGECPRARYAPPTLGQHTEAILAELNLGELKLAKEG